MATTKAVSSTGAAAPAPASSYISYRFVLAASVAIVSHYFVFTPLKRFLPFHQKYSDLVVFGASYNGKVIQSALNLGHTLTQFVALPRQRSFSCTRILRIVENCLSLHVWRALPGRTGFY